MTAKDEAISQAIDHEDAEFPYLQLARILRRRIRSGQYRPGQKIPMLIQLEAEFGPANTTIRRALNRLADEDLIVKVPGRGTFVRRAPATPLA